MRHVLLLLALPACAAGTSDPATGDDPAPGELARLASDAGAAIAPGVYALKARTVEGDDLLWLELRADGQFLRTLCWDAACAERPAQDGRFTLARSGSRHYLDFADVGGQRVDSYAWTVARGRLLLRKVYTSRWFAMAPVAAATLCTTTDGTWNGAGCDCGAGRLFGAGMGGCVPDPAWSEAECDDTGGSWTDDEMNLIGTFCECGPDRAWQDGTGCVDLGG